jgi:hypothetical protein
MRTIEITQRAGEDKLLKLAVPVEVANQRYRIVIVVVPEADANAPEPGLASWPPGFIESTYGSIQDESFIRQPQGEFEQRLEFE